jgi:hypothetical protein
MQEPEVKGADPITPAEPATGAAGEQTLTKEDVEKLIQSSNDRVRTELYQKIKAKDQEIEDLKKTTMSAAEIRKMQDEKLAQRETDLKAKELIIVATDSLRDSNLPIDFRDLVIGSDEDTTKAKVLILQKRFQKAVEDAVSEKFKSAGHEPGKGEPAKISQTFTNDQIAKMTPEEYARNAPAIMAAMAAGKLKNK